MKAHTIKANADKNSTSVQQIPKKWINFILNLHAHENYVIIEYCSMSIIFYYYLIVFS